MMFVPTGAWICFSGDVTGHDRRRDHDGGHGQQLPSSGVLLSLACKNIGNFGEKRREI